MLRRFYPDNEADSAYGIDYRALYEKGYRGVIFDIDNTLVPHGAPADERAIDLFARLRKLGFGTVLMGTEPADTVFVGDQLFTDVWGAGKLGIVTYLVKPIHPKEEIQIVLKRRLEWIVLYFYHRRQRRTCM